MPIGHIGRDVYSAMKSATGRNSDQQQHQMNQCLKIYSDIGDAEVRISDLERDIADALRQVEQLKQDREYFRNLALIGALTAATGALGSAIRAAQALRKAAQAASKGRLSAFDLFTLVPVIGGLAATVHALSRVAQIHNRIAEALRRIERLKSKAEGLESTLRILHGHYVGNNCGALVG